jgi:APA family basic amino acid/polyamine antiporter
MQENKQPAISPPLDPPVPDRTGDGGTFKRTIGLTSTILIVIGTIIGSGIFMKPALMARELGSPMLQLSVWVVAGIISLTGALSNAEAAAMYPETGGQYVFFKKMYGDGFAFLYGWAAFTVINTGGTASIAYICAQYTSYFIHLPNFPPQTENSIFLHIPFIGNIYPLANFGVKSLTVFLMVFFTFINYRSVLFGGLLQNIITALKIAALALLIGGIFLSGHGTVHNLITSSANMPHGTALISAYIAALGAAFWGYEGWNYITYVAGEVKNPQKNIPRGLFVGVCAVITIYSLTYLSYAWVMPVNTMAGSSFVASDAATIAWGVGGGSLIAMLVILSTTGATHGNILTMARVTYAMAGESKWFTRSGRLQPKYQTPGYALWLNCVWTVVLIISGSFDILTSMLIFVTWFFYGSSALGVIIMRVKKKDVVRPYKVWGYPYITVLFVAFTAFFLAVTLYTDITNYMQGKTVLVNSLLGTVITCVGIPVYYFSRRKK